MRKFMMKAAAAAALAVVAGAATAATLAQGLIPGVVNDLEDNDREAYIDANKDGFLSVGDVFIGVFRLDSFTTSGLSSNNQVYAIISNQITGLTSYDGGANRYLTLGATTISGLKLQDLTGSANANGGMFAIYDKSTAFSTNLITTSPGDVDSSGSVNMFDYIESIVGEGTLRLVAGLSASDDFLHVRNEPEYALGTPNAALNELSGTTELNQFRGGLSFLYNNTPFTFDESIGIDSFDADALNDGLYQLAVITGSSRGEAGDARRELWGSVPGYNQCGTATVNTDGSVSVSAGASPCGVVTNADFQVAPQRVPEPGSLALLGAGLLGFLGAKRARRATTKA